MSQKIVSFDGLINKIKELATPAVAVELVCENKQLRAQRDGLLSELKNCDKHLKQSRAEFEDFVASASASSVALRDGRDELLAALNKYEEAREAMFAQCLSNPVYDSWSNQVDMTLMNEAHLLSSKAIAKSVQP